MGGTGSRRRCGHGRDRLAHAVTVDETQTRRDSQEPRESAYEVRRKALWWYVVVPSVVLPWAAKVPQKRLCKARRWMENEAAAAAAGVAGPGTGTGDGPDGDGDRGVWVERD